MKPIKLYFGCSLANATPDFKEVVLALRQRISQIPSVEHLPFLTDVQPVSTPHEIFKWDVFKQLEAAEIMVAECSQPSTGLGWELSKATHIHKIPVLVFAHKSYEGKISAFMAGAEGPELPNYSFRWYESPEEVIEIVTAKIKELQDLS